MNRAVSRFDRVPAVSTALLLVSRPERLAVDHASTLGSQAFEQCRRPSSS